MQEIEFAILDFIQNNLRTDIGDQFMVFFTSLGNKGALWIGLGILLMMFGKYRKAGVMVLGSLGLNGIICNLMLKPLFARIRPFDINTAIQILIPKPSDYSFPSGHTAAAFAVVAALYMAKVKHWYVALVPACLMAFTRLYLYVHYPTDILGGIVVGGASGVAFGLIVNYFVDRFDQFRKQSTDE